MSSRNRYRDRSRSRDRSSRGRSRDIYVEEDDDVKDEGSYYYSRGQKRTYWEDEDSPLPPSIYTKEDIEALELLYCKQCDVRLHDRRSMKDHIRGKPHIKQRQNREEIEIKEGRKKPKEEVKPEYDEKFWTSAANDKKKSMYKEPQYAKVYDTDRYDKMPAKFNAKKYDYGQFKNDLYCEACDVKCETRDVLESHMSGKEHKRRAEKTPVFECEMCSVRVPCKDTLEKHKMGSDHMKREKLLKEKKYRRGTDSRMADVDMDEMQKKDTVIANLQRSVQALNLKNQMCKEKHGAQEEMFQENEKLKEEKAAMEKEIQDLKKKISTLEKSARKLKKDEDAEYTEPDVVELE